MHYAFIFVFNFIMNALMAKRIWIFDYSINLLLLTQGKNCFSILLPIDMYSVIQDPSSSNLFLQRIALSSAM